jgi:hypothetical protein
MKDLPTHRVVAALDIIETAAQILFQREHLACRAPAGGWADLPPAVRRWYHSRVLACAGARQFR